ncbi:sugar phosphate isomerase/epimerase family protein [Runella limosa]|uniref:sugar phosphate isomerase/epimerase family protein n=1 Tax=Runella limosa TaxID=370978 RepID=UPI0003F4B403|nr:sugar phosphate isomerase/epimerase family protein [Runella limosa]
MNRRDALRQTALLSATYFTAPFDPLSDSLRRSYPLGACDWSLQRACNPAVFMYAKKIGLDGVQLSYNSRSDESYLLRPENQQVMLEAAKKSGVKIASLAIGELNRVPLKSEARTVDWVSGSIDAAKALKVKVVLLAFFSQGDLRNDEAGKKVVIERLKSLIPKAEKQGITLAIESYLSAQEHLDIIEAVDSPNLKVYYDPRNAADAGHDPYTEIPLLGKRKLICEVHLKENGALLGQGSIDWPRIRQLLNEIHFKGWAQLEGAMPPGKTLDEAYPQNVQYARKIVG